MFASSKTDAPYEVPAAQAESYDPELRSAEIRVILLALLCFLVGVLPGIYCDIVGDTRLSEQESAPIQSASRADTDSSVIELITRADTASAPAWTQSEEGSTDG